MTKSDTLTLGALLGCVYIAKQLGARSDIAELTWVLGPTSVVAGWIVGAPFPFEAGYGYVNLDLRFAIVPACAGLNFLAIAIASLCCALTWGERDDARRALRLLATIPIAYVVTIVVNALRIAAAVALHAGSGRLSALDADQAHRVAGVVLFCGALVVLHDLGLRWRHADRWI